MKGLAEQTLHTTLGPCRLRVSGEGSRALVFFPAVMDSAVGFGRLQLMLRRRLPDGVATVAVDPPGYDGQDEVPGFETWPAFCAEVARELADHFQDGLVFAGNSSGAVAATEAAVRCEVSRGLVWLCWCDWLGLAPRSDALLCPEDAAGLAHLRKLSWHEPPPVDGAQVSTLLQAAARHRAHVASFDPRPHREVLAQHAGPLLVVAGDSDGLVPEAHARATAERHPLGRFVCIERSGHYPHRERPAALAAELSEFTSQCFGAGRPLFVHSGGDHAHAVRTDH